MEIIPKPIEKAPLWQNILLYLSVIILLGAIVSYFLLGYFIGENEKVLNKKKKILAQPRSEVERELERKIFQYQKKIDDLALLVNQHKISSNFFAFLEEITHPQVWFSGINLDVQKAEVELSGEAEKTALGQQILIFRENKQILRTDLSEIQMGEGEKVSFTILLSFDPEIFKFLK